MLKSNIEALCSLGLANFLVSREKAWETGKRDAADCSKVCNTILISLEKYFNFCNLSARKREILGPTWPCGCGNPKIF